MRTSWYKDISTKEITMNFLKGLLVFFVFVLIEQLGAQIGRRMASNLWG